MTVDLGPEAMWALAGAGYLIKSVLVGRYFCRLFGDGNAAHAADEEKLVAAVGGVFWPIAVPIAAFFWAITTNNSSSGA